MAGRSWLLKISVCFAFVPVFDFYFGDSLESSFSGLVPCLLSLQQGCIVPGLTEVVMACDSAFHVYQ